MAELSRRAKLMVYLSHKRRMDELLEDDDSGGDTRTGVCSGQEQLMQGAAAALVMAQAMPRSVSSRGSEEKRVRRLDGDFARDARQAHDTPGYQEM